VAPRGVHPCPFALGVTGERQIAIRQILVFASSGESSSERRESKQARKEKRARREFGPSIGVTFLNVPYDVAFEPGTSLRLPGCVFHLFPHTTGNPDTTRLLDAGLLGKRSFLDGTNERSSGLRSARRVIRAESADASRHLGTNPVGPFSEMPTLRQLGS